jgi:hypothetical protein
MNEKQILESLQEADRALNLAVVRIKELEDLLAFYANPQTWERNSFKLATAIPQDTDSLVGYDAQNKTHYNFGGAKARSYFYGKN